ncbi:MAG: HAD family hydrolase [Polyangiales bacterium]
MRSPSAPTAGPIVLFDLDGTVLTFDDPPPGPGRTAMDRAIASLYGVADASAGVRFSGGTDRGIVRALLRKCGLDDAAIDGEAERTLDRYLEHLAELLRTRRYRAIGDVAGAVAELAADGACVGVATGNVRAGARLKLESAGLGAVFDLDRGGYGCDAEPRPDILRAALARCAAAVGSRRPSSSSSAGAGAAAAAVVVVGDTVHDVTAARAIGARVVGVALGPDARRELLDARADVVVDDCGPALVAAIRALDLTSPRS